MHVGLYQFTYLILYKQCGHKIILFSKQNAYEKTVQKSQTEGAQQDAEKETTRCRIGTNKMQNDTNKMQKKGYTPYENHGQDVKSKGGASNNAQIQNPIFANMDVFDTFTIIRYI